MSVSWIFEIDGNYWSHDSITYDGNDYLAQIRPESFSGIEMRVDIVSKLHAPNTCSFVVSNVAGAIDPDDLIDECCQISLLLDGVLSRSWVLCVETAVEAYGEISVSCLDPISRKLEGDFPNAVSLASNFPSDLVLEDDDYRVPLTFGTAFIPCAPFLKTQVQYYCLGITGAKTITKIRSPRNWDLQTEWDNSYTYNQDNYTGEVSSVRGVQVIIADSDGDGTVDAHGVWAKSGRNMAPLIQYSGFYSAIVNPGEWLRNLLLQYDINTGFLNGTSFNDIDTALSSVIWGGGWWSPEPKEQVLARMLSQCDCFLSVEDDVKLNQFSATPIESLDKTKIKKLSFRPVQSTKAKVDGGVVKFAWDGEPQDVLSAEATVPLYNGGTVTNPSSEVFKYEYGYDTQEAQDFGTLFFQKKFDQKYKASFKTTYNSLTNKATIVPGQVITVNDTDLYGASKDIVITAMTIEPDLTISISGTVYNHLEDYGDMNASAIAQDTDLNAAFDFLSLAQIVSVSGESVFHFASGETVPTPTSVTLTATLFGGLTAYDWEYWTGAAWSNLSGTQNTSTYSLAYDNAAWGTDLTLRVRCKSGDYYDEITITKITDGAAGIDGADGSSGKAVKLTAVAQAFTYLTDGTSPTPSSSVITAEAFNCVGTPYFSFYVDGGLQQGPSTTATYTYPARVAFGNMPDLVEVRLRDGGPTESVIAVDQMTMLGLKAGSDAVTIMMSNEAHTFPTTNLGVVDYTGSGNDIKAWIGATPLEYSATLSITPSFKVSAVGGSVSVGSTSYPDSYTIRFGDASSALTDVSYITYTITVKDNDGNSTVFERRQSFSKANQGGDGSDGPPVVYVGEYDSTPENGQWSWPKVFYNSSTRRDVIKYSGSYYLFNGTNGATISSWSSSQWESFGATFTSVATDLLLAQDVVLTRSLTFTGGSSTLYVTGSGGLNIQSSGDITVESGADIIMESASGSSSFLKFVTQSLTFSMGVDYSYNRLFWYSSSDGNGRLSIGLNPSGANARFEDIYIIPTDLMRIWAGGILDLQGNSVSLVANSSIEITSSGSEVNIEGATRARIATTSDLSSMAANVGNVTAYCPSGYFNINVSYLRGVGYPNIGSSTTSYKFGYGYFVYDLSCRALNLTSSITGATNITASGTIQGEHLTSTDDATIADLLTINGSGSLQGLYFPNWDNAVRFYTATLTTAVPGTPVGRIWITVNGTARSIPFY